MGVLDEVDKRLLAAALQQAYKSFDEGGIPMGAVLAEGEEIIAKGRNRRVQNADPTAHAEVECLRRAGRRHDYAGTSLYLTLSPCLMCAAAVVQFGIPRVVVGDAENYPGHLELLHGRIELVLADDPQCKALMRRFIEDNPELWHEDIASG